MKTNRQAMEAMKIAKAAMSEGEEEAKKELNAKLKDKYTLLNEEADRRWDNDKIYEATCGVLHGDDTYIELAMGKFDKRFFTVKINQDGYEFIAGNCNPNYIAEDILNYFVVPMVLEGAQ